MNFRGFRLLTLFLTVVLAVGCGLFPKNKTDKSSETKTKQPAPENHVPAEGTVQTSEGEAAGTAVEIAPGTLAVGTTIGITPSDDIAGVSGLTGVQTTDKAVAVSVLDDYGQPVTTMPSPLTVSLQIQNEQQAQLLSSEEAPLFYQNLCVLLSANDGVQYVWRRGVLRLNEDKSLVSLQTVKVGVFQVAVCEGDSIATAFKDAEESGISGNYRLMTAMTVQPGDFRFAGSGPTTFCLYLMQADGGFADGFVVPFTGSAFTTHLVGDTSQLADGDTYKVYARMSASPCTLSAAGFTDEQYVKQLGPFAFSGADMKSAPPTGLLGLPTGKFPLPYLSLKLNANAANKTPKDTAVCFQALDSASGTVLAWHDATFNGASITGNSEPLALWANPTGSTYSLKTHLNTTCANVGQGSSADVLTSANLDSGAQVTFNTVLFDLRVYSDSLGTPAATKTAEVPACIVTYPNLANLSGAAKLATLQVTGTPKGDDGQGSPIPTRITTFVTNSASSPGSYKIQIYPKNQCETLSATPEIISIDSKTAASIDLIQ